LVAPEISLGGNFAYDENGDFYSSTTVYGYVKKKGITDSYKSLLAILNSQVLWWYLVNTGTVLANGYFRFMPHYIKSFPMPNISKSVGLKLEALVTSILSAKAMSPNTNTEELEEDLDKLIYSLYNLTSDEIDEVKRL